MRVEVQLHSFSTQALDVSYSYPLKQRPFWEADRSSSSWEISRILRKLKIHRRINNSPPPVSILSQIVPIYGSDPTFSKIDFNIIFPRLGLTSLRFPHQNTECTSPLPHTCYMPCPNRRKLVVSLTPRPLYPPCPPYRTLVESLSGRFGKKTNLFPFPQTE